MRGSRELTLEFPTPPPQRRNLALSWSTAAREAADGILYAREKFPGENTAYLGPPFRREPLTVEANDKMVALEEIGEHAMRVRLLKDNATGLVPLWNLEDPLERLARINMELNELVCNISYVWVVWRMLTSACLQVCSPRGEGRALTMLRGRKPKRSHSVDRKAPDDSPSSSSDESIDSDEPVTPRTPAAFPQKLNRKVEFADKLQKKVFRYIMPNESDLDSSDESDEDDSTEKAEWWWDGWEENTEHTDEGGDATQPEHASHDPSELPLANMTIA